MMKDALSKSLAKSLQDETLAIDSRFANAERVLGGEQGDAPQPRHAKVRAAKIRKKKVKVVRDTFSFPEPEYHLIAGIQRRCLDRGHNASKSELVRAGLSVLTRMTEQDLLEAVRRIEKLKPGRGRDSF